MLPVRKSLRARNGRLHQDHRNADLMRSLECLPHSPQPFKSIESVPSMRRFIAVAVVGIISCAASSAFAQSENFGRTHGYSAPVYSAPVTEHYGGGHGYSAPAYSAPVTEQYVGGHCESGNCDSNYGGYYGGRCAGGYCGWRRCGSRLRQLEQRKNYWLLARFGIR
jgi:hypothetical protein